MSSHNIRSLGGQRTGMVHSVGTTKLFKSAPLKELAYAAPGDMYWAKCSIRSTSNQFFAHIGKPTHKRDPKFHAQNTRYPNDSTKRGPRPCIINSVVIDDHSEGHVEFFPTTKLSAGDPKAIMCDRLWPLLWPSLKLSASSDYWQHLKQTRDTFHKEPIVISGAPDRIFQRYIVAVLVDGKPAEIGERIVDAAVVGDGMDRLLNISMALTMSSNPGKFVEKRATCIAELKPRCDDGNHAALLTLLVSLAAHPYPSFDMADTDTGAGRRAPK